MTKTTNEGPKAGQIKTEIHTNQYGSKVRYSLVALEGRWPDFTVNGPLKIGTGLTVKDDVKVTGYGATIGHNVTLGRCVLNAAVLGDNVTVDGNLGDQSELTACNVHEHAHVHGHIGEDAVIGSFSNVYGAIPGGSSIGKTCTVSINKRIGSSFKTMGRIEIGDRSVVKVEQSGLIMMLRQLIVGESVNAYLGDMEGEIVRIGDRASVGEKGLYCKMGDVSVPDDAQISALCTLDSTSFIIVHNGATFVKPKEGLILTRANGGEPDYAALLQELAEQASLRLIEQMNKTRKAEGRYKALGDKVRQFAVSVDHELQ